MTTLVQHKALSHPLRHRLLMSLRGEPGTISQLSRRIGVLKGSVAHHLQVLVAAGLVHPAQARQVRGGTEQYYEVAAGPIMTGNDLQATQAMLAAIAEQLAADEDPLLHLRHVRLTSAQAKRLRHVLDEIVTEVPDAGPANPAYGVVVGLYRSR